MIRVLQVNKLYAPHIGGVEKVVQDIAEGLKDRVDMKVLVCSEKGKGYTDIVNGVEIIRASSLGIYFSMPVSFSFFPMLHKLSKDMDILHFHMPFPLGDAACLLSGYKGRVVVTWHSDIIRQKALLKFYKPIMHKFLARADRIIVATEGNLLGSEYLKPYQDKCEIIPFGFDIHSVHKEENREIPYKSLKDKQKRVLFIGRLIYYKGLDVLLDAFSKVNGAVLDIVGEGPLRKELEFKARDLGISDYVTFHGRRSDDDIKKLLRECDIFVLPSVERSEAFGLVQIEAMAHAKPVINTSLPTGVPYVSIHEETGLTVPPGDAEALAKAIQRLVDNDMERIQMGLNARERVQKYFSKDKMLDSIFNLYQKLLN